MKVAQQKQHANHNQDSDSELDDDDEHGIKKAPLDRGKRT
jgi:hypothetical protein